jgi:hypothetical protein
MGKDIRKIRFKSSSQPEIEVIPLRTLTKVHKQHVVMPHRTDFYHIFLLANSSPALMRGISSFLPKKLLDVITVQI